ncbi:hypothetical protein [Radiobacillus sp. PE A8.2]|uniref:hypothetical protein n=1 Tax=Radiobacillus sp. PE A8.2 TaxID=3380349 RepID=UPI00388F6F89
MDNNTVRVMLDPKRFTSKPTGYEIGAINNRIIHKGTSLDVESLARELTNGRTMVCGNLNDKNGELKRRIANWKSQQVIALDFDNEVHMKDSNGKEYKVKEVSMTIQDALQNEFIKKYAAFLYTTFSHTKNHPKFRVVFVLDRIIHTYSEFKSLISGLVDNKFSGVVDKACKDGTRLFFGGRELYPINYENRLPSSPTLWENIQGIEYICSPRGYTKPNIPNTHSNNITKDKVSQHRNTNNSASNINLIINKDITLLQNKINPTPKTLYNNHQVYDYLKQQDLKVFLGVNAKSIYDIFHDESSPSASIFQSNENTGHWFYKCHSTSKPFTGTIITIVEKLLNCSIVDAKKFLMKVYKIEITENETQRRLKEEIDAYKYMLQSEELSILYPNFSKLFNRYGFIDNLYILLDLVKENLPADSYDPRLLFYHSIRTIAKQFRLGTTSTSKRMNFFTFFRLIYKLDEPEIPKEIKQFQLRNQKNNHHKYRNNTYEMNIYSYDFFSELEKQCEEWIRKGLTTKTMNYEGILRNYGREEADRVFPQDKGKEVSQLRNDVVSLLEGTTLTLINEKGWATEKEVLDEVTLKFKGQQVYKQDQLKRCIGDMLDKYNLQIVKTNKQVKEEYGITEEQMSVFSYPKLIVENTKENDI